MKSLVDNAQAQAWLTEQLTQARVYRWAWFMPAFQSFTLRTLGRLGLSGHVDEVLAGTAFFEWVRIVEQSEAYAQENPVDHAHYVCGCLLRCLLRVHPLQGVVRDQASSAPAHKTPPDWPEGYVITGFVCTLLETYRLRLAAGPLHWQESLFDKHWNSFRENVAEDVDRAGPFLDLLLGLDPVWGCPNSPGRRPAAARVTC